MKNNRFIYSAVAILAAGILLNACDSWKTDLEANIDQESKDYCLFATGSYWVYQDSATLETDSVIITDVSYYKSTHANPHISFLYEEYKMATTCFLNNHNNIHSLGSNVLTTEYCDDNNVENGIIKFIQLDYRNDIDQMYFDNMGRYSYINYNNSDIYEESGSYYENYYDIYQIGNNTFSKVKVFLVSYLSAYSHYFQIRTYWAKSVGIIRVEYIGEDENIFAVRNIIKYNVKPYKK